MMPVDLAIEALTAALVEVAQAERRMDLARSAFEGEVGRLEAARRAVHVARSALDRALLLEAMTTKEG